VLACNTTKSAFVVVVGKATVEVTAIHRQQHITNRKNILNYQSQRLQY